jgi:hypothetical protein
MVHLNHSPVLCGVDCGCAVSLEVGQGHLLDGFPQVSGSSSVWVGVEWGGNWASLSAGR